MTDKRGQIISDTVIIKTPEQFCMVIMGEIAYDVLEELPHDELNLNTEEQKSEIRRRIAPYLRQLPEYSHLLNKLLKD